MCKNLSINKICFKSSATRGPISFPLRINLRPSAKVCGFFKPTDQAASAPKIDMTN